MKKKLLALVLVVAMVMGLSMTAMAGAGRTDSDKGLDEYSNTVDVIIENANTTVYNVDIVWESLDFTYSFGGWDPETHLYTGDAGWDDADRTITITNHSNAPVVVASALTAEADTKGVTPSITGGNATLASAVEVAYNAVDKAASTTATVSVSGTPSENTDDATFTVGTVKVTLSAQ